MIEYVTSADGSKIAYRKCGDGPALILVHGWLEHSASHQDLARALSGKYLVLCPERRGRGRSDSCSPDYALAREVEDVAALADKYGARLIFGVNIGASIALQACKDLGCFDKAVLYEPCLAGYFANDWLENFSQALDKGKRHTALSIADKELHLGRNKLALLPARIRQQILKIYLDLEEITSRGNPSVASMIPGLERELQIASETLGWQESYRNLTQDFLLLGGRKSPAMSRECLNALEMVLPRCTRHIISNLDNNMANNLNLGGLPHIVARRMAAFFNPVERSKPKSLLQPIRIDFLSLPTLPVLPTLREGPPPMQQ